jgi:pectin methylesterase-like acyl-CoA thioesterase
MALRLALSTICAMLLCTSHAQLSGTYTVGAGNTQYATLQEAFAALHEQGAQGEVVFLVMPGVYEGQLQLGPVPGAPTGIVLRGATGVPGDVVLSHTSTTLNEGHVLAVEGACAVRVEALTLRGRHPAQKRLVLLQQAADGLLLHNCVFEQEAEVPVMAGPAVRHHR